MLAQCDDGRWLASIEDKKKGIHATFMCSLGRHRTSFWKELVDAAGKLLIIIAKDGVCLYGLSLAPSELLFWAVFKRHISSPSAPSAPPSAALLKGEPSLAITSSPD